MSSILRCCTLREGLSREKGSFNVVLEKMYFIQHIWLSLVGFPVESVSKAEELLSGEIPTEHLIALFHEVEHIWNLFE